MWRELCYFAALSPHDVDLQFLPWGLHNTPSLLNSEVQKAIDASYVLQTDPNSGPCDGECHPDAILLGYGLCSNGVVNLTARQVPLVIPRGHDCITCFLGSKERYQEYFDKHPGTYWYTPGWIENHLAPGEQRYTREYERYKEKYGEENAEYLIQMEQDWFHSYNNAAYTDMGLGNRDDYVTFTKECAAWLKWGFDDVKGDPRLIKALVSGEWDDRDFLVVQPGQKIVPTYDERIITAE